MIDDLAMNSAPKWMAHNNYDLLGYLPQLNSSLEPC